MPRTRKASSPAHSFGGNWTETKLEILSQYLKAYSRALSRQPFQIEYIDAFAGTGYRTLKDAGEENLLFPDLAESDPQKWLDGSASNALKVEPGFKKYVFIEKNRERCKQLENLKSDFTAKAASIEIVQGEANKVIQDLCKGNWSGRRAVLFLDPYGMQVEWSTLEAIAQTKAIDLWLLFPLGIGVNRLLTNSGVIRTSWQTRLDLLLGTHQWYEDLYKFPEDAPKLLFDVDHMPVKATSEVIGRYFNDRLKLIFSGVASNPRILTNTRGCPLYLFCFAVGNKAGTKIALDIAQHILGRA